MNEQINKQVKILLAPGYERLHQSQAFWGRETPESNYWGSNRKCEWNSGSFPAPAQTFPGLDSHGEHDCSELSIEINNGCYTNIHRFFQLLLQMWNVDGIGTISSQKWLQNLTSKQGIKHSESLTAEFHLLCEEEREGGIRRLGPSGHFQDASVLLSHTK